MAVFYIKNNRLWIKTINLDAKVTEGRGEAAAFFRCKYNNGLQLDSLLAWIDSVPVVCTGPVDLQLTAICPLPNSRYLEIEQTIINNVIMISKDR